MMPIEINFGFMFISSQGYGSTKKVVDSCIILMIITLFIAFFSKGIMMPKNFCFFYLLMHDHIAIGS
jgi:hypothetical protein